METKDRHRSTQRVIDILENIAQSGNAGLSLTELTGRLGAPKSSLFPIIHTLCENKMISMNQQSGKYTMGYKTYELGSCYIQGDSVNASILELMNSITAQCRETCFFGELIDGDVFYVFKVDSPESLRMVTPGKKLPAYSSGIGKALLSDKTLEELRQLYPEPLTLLTPNTITDLSVLYQQLQVIKAQGIAFEKEESTQFIQCVAIPIHKNGLVRAALSVAVPVFRYSPEKEAMIIGLLKQAQIKIEMLLASNDWTHF